MMYTGRDYCNMDFEFERYMRRNPSRTPEPDGSCHSVVQVYLHGEKFNQPIFGCNNISGQVNPVSSSSLIEIGVKSTSV